MVLKLLNGVLTIVIIEKLKIALQPMSQIFELFMKKIFSKLQKRVTKGIDHEFRYGMSGGGLHREDGPAYVYLHTNGEYIEEWWYNNIRHRYGGPAVIDIAGSDHIWDRHDVYEYWINGEDVTDEVEIWMADNDREWDTMSDIEKWELEIFMRTLG